jgi:hypothetical protein
MESRTYSVSEANRALPLVRRIAADAVRAFREAADLRGEAEELQSTAASEAGRRLLAALEERLRRAAAELAGCAAECAELCCRLEDPATGAVGFPSVLDDRPVVLCWRPGDRQVEHWHEADEPCARRKPLPVGVPGI